MKQFIRFSLFLALAASLMAQTSIPCSSATSACLSIGEATLLMPANGTPPTGSSCVSGPTACYTVDIVLATGGTSFATAPNQPVGLQFDLNYDPGSLNVVIGLGASATAASAQLATVCLGEALTIPPCTTPAAYSPWQNASPAVTADNGNPGGQRAVIIGCCSSGQIAGTSQPTSSVIADGVVATLTVQATSATPANSVLQLMGSPYMVATTSGINSSNQNVGASTIPLTIGATSWDPSNTGKLNMSGMYVVGSVLPETSDSAPNFGSGYPQLVDVVDTLFAFAGITGASSYPVPACGSDRWDAMDLDPQDTPAQRGGQRNGSIDLQSVVVDLFRFAGVADLPVPVRTSSPYTCPSSPSASPAASPGTRRAPRARPQVTATLVVGANEGAGTGQDRIPIYLEARQDLSKVGVGFGLGDQQSRLQFQAATGVAPSLLQDGTSGVQGALAVAWLNGLEIRGGQRMLLGYVVGPAGSGANLRFSAASACFIDSLQDVGLDVSGAGLVRR